MASAPLLAEATTLPVHSVTPFDASASWLRFSEPRGDFTLEATTNCVVLAAISCEHTISSSNFPSPRTTLSAASLEIWRRLYSQQQNNNNDNNKKSNQQNITIVKWKLHIPKGKISETKTEEAIRLFSFSSLVPTWDSYFITQTVRYIHQHISTPSYSLSSWYKAFCPSVMFFVKFFGWCSALGDKMTKHQEKYD